MAAKTKVVINRAPVLTLWATIVARRLGFRKDEALSLGKAVAGLNAQAKGRRLGIYHPRETKPAQLREKQRAKTFYVEICGRPVPAIRTPEGIRATIKGKPIDPAGVQRYLEQKFGDDLKRVQSAMEKLARSYPPRELADRAYPLYESFRPEVPDGVRGWGAKGVLDLKRIERLAKHD